MPSARESAHLEEPGPRTDRVAGMTERVAGPFAHRVGEGAPRATPIGRSPAFASS